MEFVYMESYGQFKVIGEMRDDVVGEVYDKVVCMLNFLYLGGLYIDCFVYEGELLIDLLCVWLEEGFYDFSFSGLKLVVINIVYNVK